MKTEIIDINNNSEMVNFIESTKEAQNEITYEEKRNIINNATMRIKKS